MKKPKLRTQFSLVLSKFGRSIAALFDFGDVLFVAAVASIAYGVAQIYPPAAWIVVGLIFIVVGMRMPSGGDR